MSSKPLDRLHAAALVRRRYAGPIVPTFIDDVATPNRSPDLAPEREHHLI
jgi:hypothetical protein